jgi:hypothetical protein
MRIVAGELDLVLDLIALNGGTADRALDAVAFASSSPCTVRMAIGQPPGRDRFAGFLAEHALVAHSSGPVGTHIGLSASFPIKVRLAGFIILIPSIQYRPNFRHRKVSLSQPMKRQPDPSGLATAVSAT